MDNLEVHFERPNKKGEEDRVHEGEKDNLLKIIGEREIENDFLKKSTGNCSWWGTL